MLKQLLIAICVYWLAYTGVAAQSLRVETPRDVVRCALGSYTSLELSVANHSGKPITFKVKRIKASLTDHQSVYFTLGDKTTPSRNAESANAFTLSPHHSETVFTAYFVAGFHNAKGSVVYRFYNVADPNDYVDVPIQYEVSSAVHSEQEFFTDSHINISHIYPNPVSGYGEFSYRLADDHPCKAQLAFFNVLGKPVGTYELNHMEYRLVISFKDWNPGVYFYTLMLDGHNIITKKFVLRR